MIDQEKAKEFQDEYKKLCEKYGVAFAAAPKLIPSGHGTFEIGVETTLIKLPEKAG